jgi:Tfp pilus assembly protein PilP
VTMRLLLLVALVAVSLSPAAQASAGQAPAGQAPAGKAPAAPAAPAPAGAQAAGTEPQGFTYNPEGRRDPFVSLIRRGGTGLTPTIGSARPAGLSGLETAEVTLKGTIQSQTGYVGILLGADNKTYIVRVGDKLLDGTVRAITQNAMVILQQVNDPLSLEKQREIRKVLRQTEEAK